MRSFAILLAVLPLAALAQSAYQQQEPPVLYPYKKQQIAPAVVYEQEKPGIPTSGTAQARQLKSNQPGQQKSGPTIMHRSYDKKGSTAVISGPNGTTVCSDSYGKRSATTVCY